MIQKTDNSILGLFWLQRKLIKVSFLDPESGDETIISKNIVENSEVLFKYLPKVFKVLTTVDGQEFIIAKVVSFSTYSYFKSRWLRSFFNFIGKLSDKQETNYLMFNCNTKQMETSNPSSLFGVHVFPEEHQFSFEAWSRPSTRVFVIDKNHSKIIEKTITKSMTKIKEREMKDMTTQLSEIEFTVEERKHIDSLVSKYGMSLVEAIEWVELNGLTYPEVLKG